MGETEERAKDSSLARSSVIFGSLYAHSVRRRSLLL